MKNIIITSLASLVLINCNKTNLSSCCKGNASFAAVDSSFITVPDIFTPNGDGINDLLFVRMKYISTINLIITKKSGKILFNSSDLLAGWDGTFKGNPLKEKNYSYTVDAITINGKSLSLTGNICVIRDNCAKGGFQNCFFDSQFNGYGFDKNLPSNEGNIQVCN